ncbi:protein brunelleschi isoform X2 [Ischnura elegans]|uniref:protein brunelleschi isoform X2 n=1 Tax=Ischnura elegans TaxID=197161 RepID=UPI001ED8B6DD|nr:protein brunelleschi isoform X2 [Ischnura elegans]
MRSAVSAILSAPAPDTRMSHPDYRQTAHDHSALLVLVRHIGRQLKQKSFERVLERIRRVSRLRVVVDPSAAAAASATGAPGGPPWPREITARYVTDYPVENNDWGDFQTHRRVLGLVSVGKCDSQQELNELCRVHESLKVKYASTLFDSRCVVFGLYPDGTPVISQANAASPPVQPEASLPQSPTVPCSPSPPLASSEDLSTPSPPPYQRLGKLADNGEANPSAEGTNSIERVSPLPEDDAISALIGIGIDGEKIAQDGDGDAKKNDASSPGSPTPIISADPLQDLIEDGSQPVKIPRSKKKRPPPPPRPEVKDVPSSVEVIGQNDGQSEERRPVRPTNIDLKHKLKPANMSSPTPSSATASTCSSVPSSPSPPSSSSSTSNPTPPAAPFSTPPNFKTRPLFYPDLESAIGKGVQSSTQNGTQDLESAMREFLASLFWVLESKRLVLAGNKSGTGTGSSTGPLGSAGSAITAPASSADGNLPSLPYCAPFERRDFVGLSLDSRAARRRWAGRALKRLGDLSCQAGAPTQAAAAYASAAETLKAANDWLWLGGAYEGHCSVSVCVLYPNPTLIPPLQRNASFPDGILGGVTNGGSPGKRRPSPTLSPSRSSSSIASTPSPTTCSSSAQSPSPTTSSPTTSLASTPSSSSSGSSSMNGAANTPDLRNCLSADEVMKKYREAIVFYSQYQHAGIIEMEACFKAARVAIELNRPLQAASFLQNVVLINPNLDEEEKIQRFTTLSDLYWRMGFGRKASMCLRLGAMRHVSPSNPQPQWDSCHSLLLGALTRGHKVSLDPTVFPGDGLHPGWPKLQIQVLRELVVAARSMGNGALATRHLTFLLQTMWHHMSTGEKKELCNQLRSLTTAHGDGSPVPLVLPTTGLVVPPANLTHLPQALSFQVQDLAPHLRPRRLQEASKEDSGPFLFTPLHFGSMERSTTKNSGKMEFSWVEGEVCEVAMKVSNPLPFELKVSNMRLLTDELVFETVPSSLSLPTESGPHPVSLKGIPKETGELHILGYSTHVLGVKSNCRLRDLPLPGIPRLPRIVLKVVPALPLATVSTSLPRSATFSSLAGSSASSGIQSRRPGGASGTSDYSVVTSASASLYAGESQECTITISNSGRVPIEMLNVTMAGVEGVWGGEIPSSDSDEDEGKMFRWSKENVASQLPIAPGASASFTLYLYAAGKFLGGLPPEGGDGGPDGEDGGDYSSLASSMLRGGSSVGPTSGSSSLPSRLGGVRDKRPDSAASFASMRSGGSIRSNSSSVSSSASTSATSGRVPNLPELHGAHWQNSVQTIEGLLKIQYSGGPGMVGGFCRVCSVALCMEIRPSVRLTNWDVIPAETPSQFYLVLDAINASGSELELCYTPIKSILMEAGESCRVPIPLQRCPLSKLLTQSNRKYSPRASPSSRRMDAAEMEGVICSQHISSLVDLRWSLPGTGTRGKASLSGFQCSREMLQIIKASPLIWEVMVNSELVRPQEEITCSVGDALCLGVRIKVCSGLGSEDPSSPGYASSSKISSQTISESNGHNKDFSDNNKQSKHLESSSSQIPSDSEVKPQLVKESAESTLSLQPVDSVPEIPSLVVSPTVVPGTSESNPSAGTLNLANYRFTLPKLALSLRFFQDHRNGVNNYLLDTRLATAGAVNRVPLPQLCEGGEAYHEASVVFFTPGQYKVDISCSSVEGGASGYLGKAGSNTETSSTTTWRFVPPIEITVEDM